MLFVNLFTSVVLLNSDLRLITLYCLAAVWPACRVHILSLLSNYVKIRHITPDKCLHALMVVFVYLNLFHRDRGIDNHIQSHSHNNKCDENTFLLPIKCDQIKKLYFLISSVSYCLLSHRVSTKSIV